MKRSEFIQNLASLFGLSVLPKSILIKQYIRIYLLQSFIRGFRFYDGPKLLEQMNEGDLLELVREPENEYDNCAIALYFDKIKIGYLPAEDNVILSRLLDAGVIKLQAEITHLKKEAKAWENVHIGVYVLKETDEPLPEDLKYLSVLETPKYRSLKIDKNKIATIYYENEADEEMMNADEFYKEMVNNSRDNSIYDILHREFVSGEVLENAINGGKIILNKNTLPEDLLSDNVVNALNNQMVTLDGYFNKEGYIVANVNRVAKLSGRIDKVVTTTDKVGREFFEIVFQKK